MSPQSQRQPVLVDDDPLEIHVVDHLVVLWRRRVLILLVTVLCAACAAGALSLMEPEYRASAKIVVLPSLVGDRTVAQLEQVYQTLASSHELAARAIDALALNKGSHTLSSQELVQNHLEISGSRESGVITVDAAMWSGDLAARLANEMAAQLVQAAKQLNARQLAASASTLQDQVGAARAKLADVENRLTKANQDAGVDLLQTDVTSRMALRRDLLGLTATIESEKARLARAQEQLGTQERVRANPRSVDGGSPLESGDGSASLQLRAETLNPYINPVYESLNQQVANSATSLAGLEKRRSELVNVLGLAGDTDPQVRLLYAKKAEIEALQRDYEIARTAYIAVSARHQEIALRLAGEVDDIRVLDTAAIPLRRSSPRILRNTVIWTGVGLITACVWVLAGETLSDVARRSRVST